MATIDYPAWVCSDCGNAHGRRPAGICTFHVDVCGICGRDEMVTEPRDYGHLKESWKEAARQAARFGHRNCQDPNI